MEYIKLVFRYGLLLAIFLAALDIARRSYFTLHLDVEIYVGIVAAVFLVFGGWLAIKTIQSKNEKSEPDHFKLLDQNIFSKREGEVLLFLCHGYTNREIADQLLITTNTVITHIKNIYVKLGVNNRTQAAAEAKLLNIIGS